MPEKNLATRFRPQRLSQVVGNGDVVATLSKLYDSGKFPHALLFAGPTGSGKTTLARILAVSAQCSHQEKFGEPCDDCIEQAQSGKYDIMEINASDATGVDEIRMATRGYSYAPMQPSQRRVYILDEAHRLSSASQNLLLKSFEDGPPSTMWIICTTEVTKVLKTLRGRCLQFNLKELSYADIGPLVDCIIAFEGKKVSTESRSKFVSGLEKRNICLPRTIVNLTEMFLTGKVVWPLSEGAFTKFGQLVLAGDWESVRKFAAKLDPEGLEEVRLQLAGYFTTILLGSKQGKDSRCVANMMMELLTFMPVEPVLVKARIILSLYHACDTATVTKEDF